MCKKKSLQKHCYLKNALQYLCIIKKVFTINILSMNEKNINFKIIKLKMKKRIMQNKTKKTSIKTIY